MKNKLSILVIEDEKNICDFIYTTLSTQNYKVFKSYTALDGLSTCTSQCPDFILLDLGLPDMDGMNVLKQIRSWSNVPIIIISARNQEHEKVQALDLGADDYITKPFGTHELLARIRTALRHNNNLVSPMNSSNKIFHTKDLTINFENRQVSIHSELVHLTQVEYKLVSLLAHNAGRVLTYDSIITQIWGPYADSNNRILRVNMANIRRKLEKNPADPSYIFTEIGIGYRMSEEDYN